MSQAATFPDLSTVEPVKQYWFNDNSVEKKEEWGRQLWRLLRPVMHVNPPEGFRSADDLAFISERLTNYVLSRLVVRGMLIHHETRETTQEVQDQRYSDLIEDVLNVDSITKGQIVWLLSRICKRISTKGSELNPRQKQAVKRFGQQEGHACYFCGIALSYGEPTSDSDDSEDIVTSKRRNGFEVEHIFPSKRGGGRNRSNLVACCEACNKYKDVRLSFADFPIEKAITKSSDPEQIRIEFSGPMQFALLWSQKGTCAFCTRHFFSMTDSKLFLTKKNNDDVFHFLNCHIVCNDCNETHNLEGIEVRE